MRGLKKTGITNLWKSEAGVYYLVVKVKGKRLVRSLGTKVQADARELLPERLRQEKSRVAREEGMVPLFEGKALPGSWGEIVQAWLAHQVGRPDLQEGTKDYYEAMVTCAFEFLDPELLVVRTSRAEMTAWWGKVASRRAERTANNVLAAVRGALEFAAENGKDVPEGLLGGCKKLKLPPRELVVPTNSQLEEILVSVESTGGEWCAESRDFIEFLAFVGCRIGEALEVTWGDVKEDEILIRGKKDARGRARTKGGDFRRVPIASRIGLLLDRRRYVGMKPGDPLFRIKTPRLALEGACRRLGLPHLRIHDLRHFFATHCIERGVDIPTVAGWLGHKDGGVLAMKTYGHVRNLHSREMGKRIG